MVLGQASAADPVLTQLVEADKVPWYKKKNLRALYFILLPTCMGVEMTSGFDSSMMNGLQSVANWDEYFNHPTGSKLGIFSAIYSLGAIVVLPLVPFVNDRFGRRMCIVVGSCIMIFGAILQGCAQNFVWFLMSRFFLGCGIPFAIVAASSLIGELSYPKERAVLTSLFNASWFIGAIVAASITLGTFAMPNTWSWRIPSILQIFPSLLQVTFIWFLPESPRWLISHDRGDEALAILIKYHAEGDESSAFARAEFAQIRVTLEIEAEASKRSWKEMIATPGMRKRVLIGSALGLFTQWSGNGLISYYLSKILTSVGVTNKKTQNRINVANTCWGLINGTVMALAVFRFKRRTMYLACTCCLLMTYTGWTIASAKYAQTKSDSAGIAVIFFIFLYSPMYNMGYNALTYTYLVELFPFQVRSRGITIFQWWGRMAGFFNNFVNPIGLKNIGWKYYLTYVVWLAFEVCFVYFLFPETSGRTLEELSFLFEGDEANKRVEEATEKHLHDHNNTYVSKNDVEHHQMTTIPITDTTTKT
ncbi:hexose transporter [Peziza echinospora]|nr:hexose transporter [Peziza echinospora]